MKFSSTTTRAHAAFFAVAIAIVLMGFALWGSARGPAVLAGAALAAVNWVAIRWIMGRLVESTASQGGGEGAAGPPRVLVSLLLVAKIGLLMVAVYLLIQRAGLDPIGLAFGLGVMFLGPLVSSIAAGAGRPLSPSAASAASKER